jgi:hypothetical protein
LNTPITALVGYRPIYGYGNINSFSMIFDQPISMMISIIVLDYMNFSTLLIIKNFEVYIDRK